MAGSYGHITDDDGRFRGTDLIEDLGDASEALEQMYGMIAWLATRLMEQAGTQDGPVTKRKAIVAEAQRFWKQGLWIGGDARRREQD